MELDDLRLDVNLEEIEKRNLINLAAKIQDALWDVPGLTDKENVAQLLEVFANLVREGEI